MLLPPSLVLYAVVSVSSATTTPEAPAFPISGSIRLDGVLDEPEWSSVPTIGRLLQQEPTPESEPTEETEVRVLFGGGQPEMGGRRRSVPLRLRPRHAEVPVHVPSLRLMLSGPSPVH